MSLQRSPPQPLPSKRTRKGALADGPAAVRRCDDRARRGFAGPAARARSRSCPSSRRCATRRATSRTTRWQISISISNAVRAQGLAPPAATCTGPRPRKKRAQIHPGVICRKVKARTVTKGKSMIGEEIAINDFLEAERHRADRDGSGRVHHPDPPRAAPSHIIAPAIHLNKGRRSRPAFRRDPHASPIQTACWRSRKRLLDRGARDPARPVSWLPTSASPAPTS